MAVLTQAKSIDDFKTGDAFAYKRHVLDADVRAFAEVSGDHNPIHLDDEYAKSTRFGGRIAHGALLVAFISKVLGMDLPGLGAVYLSQSIEFLKPVHVGDEVEIRVRVDQIDREQRVLSISNEILSSRGHAVARGLSKIKMPRHG
jgi:acyl dehydratase